MYQLTIETKYKADFEWHLKMAMRYYWQSNRKCAPDHYDLWDEELDSAADIMLQVMNK